MFWLLCASAVPGAYCFVGDVFWPGYFPALRIHLWAGFAVLVVTVPALAWHVRQTASPLLPSLGLPAALLAAVALAMPGRPEYPSLGPVGWAAGAAALQLALTAACARAMPQPARAPGRVSVSGIVLTAVLVFCLHVGVFGWWMRGDERWGAMLVHSVFGAFAAVLILPHLLWFRRLVARRAGVPVVTGVLLLLAWWWKSSYPHDILIEDMQSPTQWDDEPEVEADPPPGEAPSAPLLDPLRRHARTPGSRAERLALAGSGTKLDPALVGDSAGCGDAGCHEALTRQWAGSAHRFAADNLFYRKVVELLVRERGVEEAAFCANCHDPVRVLTGTVTQAYASGAPPPGEGVGCVSCHGTVHVPLPPANGVQVLREPRRYPGESVEARNANIRLDPRAHRQDLVSNFRMEAPGRSCAMCHRVQLGPDMGAGIEAVVQAAAAEPWDPGAELACGDCHMPTLTIVRPYEQAMYDHHMSGVNLDLDLYAWGEAVDRDAIRLVRENTARFLAGTLDLLGLEQERRIYEIPRETIAVLKKGGAVGLELHAERRDAVLHVVAETTNHRAGHPFPNGPFDLHEVWQELIVRDADGAEIFALGRLDESLGVDPRAHRLGATELARDGLPLRHHRIWDVAGVAGHRVIARGESVSDRYEVPIPEGARAPLSLRVAWKFRRAPQDFADWVFDGDGTTFPLHEMAVAEASVP
jgi:hypothetical protein